MNLTFLFVFTFNFTVENVLESGPDEQRLDCLVRKLSERVQVESQRTLKQSWVLRDYSDSSTQQLQVYLPNVNAIDLDLAATKFNDA